MSREGWKLITLLRLSPIVPWNMLNYALAITGKPVACKPGIPIRAAAALSMMLALPARAAACPGYVMNPPVLCSMAAVTSLGRTCPSLSGSTCSMHCNLKSAGLPKPAQPRCSDLPQPAVHHSTD